MQLISNYSKVVGYKINVQKLIAFLYTSNRQLEFEIKNTISITTAPKKNKSLRYKSNKICTESVCGKLQNSNERYQRSQ